MNFLKNIIILSLVTTIFSCNSAKKQTNSIETTIDTSQHKNLELQTLVVDSSYQIIMNVDTLQFSFHANYQLPYNLTTKLDSIIKFLAVRKLVDIIEQPEEKFDYSDLSSLETSLNKSKLGKLAVSLQNPFSVFLDFCSKRFNTEAKEYNVPAHSFDLTFELVYETPKLLVFKSVATLYCGGAHGGMLIDYDMIDIENRRIMMGSKDLFNSSACRALQPILRKELARSFSISDEELNDNLMVENTDSIPLPSVVAITDEGVVFQYQEYEIACYAMGRPSFILPLEGVTPYLKPEIVNLITSDEQ